MVIKGKVKKPCRDVKFSTKELEIIKIMFYKKVGFRCANWPYIDPNEWKLKNLEATVILIYYFIHYKARVEIYRYLKKRLRSALRRSNTHQ